MQVNFAKTVTMRKVGLRSLQADVLQEQAEIFAKRVAVNTRVDKGWQVFPQQITEGPITNEDVAEFRKREEVEKTAHYNELKAAALAEGKAVPEDVQKYLDSLNLVPASPEALEAATQPTTTEGSEGKCYSKEYLLNLDIVNASPRERKPDVLQREFDEILGFLRSSGRGKHWLVEGTKDAEYTVVETQYKVVPKAEAAAVTA